MKVVFILGDGAVGKMSVGQELMKLTQLRLFHNHMTIEPVLEIFGSVNGKAVYRLRDVIFEEFAVSGQYGLIFTYMFAFDQPSEWAYLDHVKEIFLSRCPDVTFYYAELVASQKVRLERNVSENRLKMKASKNDVEASNARIVRDDAKYRLESRDGEVPFEHYIKIDNTDLSAEQAARQIKEAFDL